MSGGVYLLQAFVPGHIAVLFFFLLLFFFFLRTLWYCLGCCGQRHNKGRCPSTDPAKGKRMKGGLLADDSLCTNGQVSITLEVWVRMAGTVVLAGSLSKVPNKSHIAHRKVLRYMAHVHYWPGAFVVGGGGGVQWREDRGIRWVQLRRRLVVGGGIQRECCSNDLQGRCL